MLDKTLQTTIHKQVPDGETYVEVNPPTHPHNGTECRSVNHPQTKTAFFWVLTTRLLGTYFSDKKMVP